MSAVEIPAVAPSAVGYAQLTAAIVAHPAVRAELPVEFASSFPVPTLRLGRPAWAAFAGPASRRRGQPLRLWAPDRWWALDQWGHSLVLYALVSAQPFGAEVEPGPVEVSPPAPDVASYDEDQRVLAELMDSVAPTFFNQGELAKPARSALLEHLSVQLVGPAVVWYRPLAPDFFAWLEA
jgi:hypothetical protein